MHGETGLMTLTFGRRSTAHAPVVARSELALFHTWLNHNRYRQEVVGCSDHNPSNNKLMTAT